VEELETFDEVGACGTAAVITPIRKIVDLDNNKFYDFSNDNKPGPISTQLYDHLTAVQFGDEPDKWEWIKFID
jgi:branched-chain amino acid aminotransferase